MSLTDALDRYFAAWNDHDPQAVVRSLADGGSYEGPTTGGPLTGDALAANVATLLAGFPDVHFDLVRVAPTSDTTAVAQWLMRGTNTGPMPAVQTCAGGRRKSHLTIGEELRSAAYEMVSPDRANSRNGYRRQARERAEESVPPLS